MQAGNAAARSLATANLQLFHVRAGWKQDASKALLSALRSGFAANNAISRKCIEEMEELLLYDVSVCSFTMPSWLCQLGQEEPWARAMMV